MRIEVLGPVRLSTDEGEPVEVAERHLRLLLASLVTAEGEPVSADVLIDRLWEDTLPANPKKVLRAKLSRLRTLLDRARPGGRDLLTHTPAGYRLAVDAGDIDAGRFKAAVERARGMEASSQKTQLLQTALETWRGMPYGDNAEELWLAPTITELTDLRGEALEALIGTLLDLGEPEPAIAHANGALEDYPTRERLIGAVMVALYQVGRQHEALEAFESLRRCLSEDLGVDPSPELRELHARLLRQDPTLTSTSSPAPAAPRGTDRSNLPAETTPLIGRRHESEQITALLSKSRVVTLTGIGGVGKTRLALHLAREQTPAFERGIWFIDLTELTATPEDRFGSAERIASLAASALDLPEQSATDAFTRVRDALRSRPVLLVLDNAEHVVSEAAVFVAELVRHTAAARVLATSREPLGVPEEQRYDVATLSTQRPEDGGASEAMEFFAARARASDPSFTLDTETADTVAALCRHLDGLPLALELAAGRIRGLSAQDLLDRLNDRLNLLRRPGRGAPRRQQTLRAMIDWSWSLLDETERAVLRRLAVHPGTVSLHAAEKICADDPEDTGPPAVEASRVVDVLVGLVDRSMIHTTATPAGLRYGLLESIAAYAGEKLDASGDRGAAARRHLRHYLDFAREADQHLRVPEQREWLPRLEAEHAQLRHAFDEAVRTEDGRSAVALVVATFWYRWISGRQVDLGRDLDAAIALPGPRDDAYATAATLALTMRLYLYASPSDADRHVTEALSLFDDAAARARAQWFAGASFLGSGMREVGERHVNEAVDMLYTDGREWDAAVAVTLRNWFIVATWGDAPRDLPGGNDPGAVLRRIGDGYGLSQVLAVEYRTAEMEGHYRRAGEAAQRALDVCHDLGLWAEAAYWHVVLAITALRSGDVSSAYARLKQGRSLAADIAYEYGLHFAAFAESMIARYEGDLARARALLDTWLTHGTTAVLEPAVHLEDGFLAVREARLDHAETVLGELHEAIGQTASSLTTARLLELAAAIRAHADESRAAAELLGTAAALRAHAAAEPSVPERRDIDQVYERLREQWTEPELSETIACGRTFEAHEKLTEAVSTSPTS